MFQSFCRNWAKIYATQEPSGLLFMVPACRAGIGEVASALQPFVRSLVYTTVRCSFVEIARSVAIRYVLPNVSLWAMMLNRKERCDYY